MAKWKNFFSDLSRSEIVAEELHTRFDDYLGWVNKPSTYIENMYGQGNNLTILENSTRLTTHSEKTSHAHNVICLGDSFTFGYCVDDLEAWCSLLNTNNIKTINMGMGGYGLDQSFLWYLRDKDKFSHDIVISASI